MVNTTIIMISITGCILIEFNKLFNNSRVVLSAESHLPLVLLTYNTATVYTWTENLLGAAKSFKF